MSKLLPEQERELGIHFSYAIARGNPVFAKKILLQIDVFKQDNFGLCPAILGLASAHIHPQDMINLLQKFYPDVPDPLPNGDLATLGAEEAVRILLLDKARLRFVQIIKTATAIVSHNPYEHKDIIALIYALALDSLVKFCTLDNQKRNLTNKLIKSLVPNQPLTSTINALREFRESTHMSSTKMLLSFLNGCVVSGFDLESGSKSATQTIICPDNEMRSEVEWRKRLVH